MKNLITKISLALLLTVCLANTSFAEPILLVNQSTQDILVVYKVCISKLNPAPVSDCQKDVNVIIPAGKISDVKIDQAPTDPKATLVVQHAQNAESYGNFYVFGGCSARENQPALFSITDGHIFCAPAAGGIG